MRTNKRIRYAPKPAFRDVHARMRVPENPNTLLTNDQLADTLGVHRIVPVIWRREGRGPKFYRPADARVVVYRWSDVERWLLSGVESKGHNSRKATEQREVAA